MGEVIGRSAKEIQIVDGSPLKKPQNPPRLEGETDMLNINIRAKCLIISMYKNL